MEFDERELQYLNLLSKQYPTIRSASTEIINLNAILNLPKGTEHYLSDVHGEYEAFEHVIKNGSGSIRRKIDDIFADSLLDKDKRTLATIIYYPERKLGAILPTIEDKEEWFRITLFRLVKVCKVVSSKYTRSKVRKALPDDFAYVIEELLHEESSGQNKQQYYESIINTIISTGRATGFIIAISEVIQQLAIDHLHVIGDVYDRGPGAHIIMERLSKYHSIDVQWGNHDILWMGAAAGSEACMATVIRICLRYSNMATLQDGYAISLLPLATFTLDVYGDDDPGPQFQPKLSNEREFSEYELALMAKMHKSISIIQFKLEGQIIKRCPQYGMEDRLVLDMIDYEKGTICLDGKEYPLNDTNFPTIDPKNPYELTEQEQLVVDNLKISFANSDKLQQHVRFLYSKGSVYLTFNGNLLYHGCIPMDDKGNFEVFRIDGETYTTRDYMDRMDRLAREAYFSTDPERKLYGLDTVWYLWTGPQSPLFGKNKMTTFERYFVDDKETHIEVKNPYYKFRDSEEICHKIIREFDLNPETAHIITGHIPVKAKKGENPVKANGKMIAIDGGFSRAYQSQTGIAGYTLVYNSYGLMLASHYPFDSTQAAIEEEIDIHPKGVILETNYNRIRVKDTDIGRKLKREIDALQRLLTAYRTGFIPMGTK